jgi:hypothetical protein
LRCRHRPVELRSIVTDDGEILAALKPERGQTQCQRANLVGCLRPSPRLPDTQIFFPN